MGVLTVILTEEEQNRIIFEYKNAIERTVEVYVSLCDRLSEKSEKYQLDSYKCAVNDLISAYKVLPEIISNDFCEWRNGVISISHLLVSIGCDYDDAIQNVRNFEIKLYDTQKGIIKSHYIAELTHPTANPNYSIHEIQEDISIVAKNCDNIESIKKEITAIFEEKAEENSVYLSVLCLIEMIMKEIQGILTNGKTYLFRIYENLIPQGFPFPPAGLQRKRLK